MSLYGALFSGVSGLNAFSSAIGSISDNISNVNTVGYKASDAQFATLVTETRSTTSYAPGGVGAKIRTLISGQGLLQASTSNTDLAVDGAGFFVTRTKAENGAGEVQFTRAGSFRPDAAGFLRNAGGLYVQGYALASDGTYVNDGNVNSLSPINIASLTGTAEATTSIKLRANLKSSQPAYAGTPAYSVGSLASGAVEPQFTRPQTIYDAQGGSHTLTFSFVKSATPNQWNVEAYAAPGETAAPNGLLFSGTIAFNADGSLNRTASSPALFQPATPVWTNGAGAKPIELALGTDGDVDGITQFDSQSALISSTIDGAVFGNVTGVNIGQDGVVTALFDNGLTRQVYKLPLAVFQNADGLTRRQSNAYSASDNSGTYSLVDPLSGGGGQIASSTLEASTVDLAAEFSRLIITQRAYSASTKIITTANELLQELTQVIR
jgi:flagellar hook protein FlgE